MTIGVDETPSKSIVSTFVCFISGSFNFVDLERFSDAREEREGLFEAAEGSTVILDEIGEMPLDVQVHLLRVLDQRQVQRIGERREDIPLLAEHFLREIDKDIDGFAPEVLEMLQSYHWPGNMRELQKTIRQTVAFVEEGGRIETYHFPVHIARGESLIQEAMNAICLLLAWAIGASHAATPWKLDRYRMNGSAMWSLSVEPFCFVDDVIFVTIQFDTKNR
ncbi:TPA: hypothetical protein EYP66_22025 [Candidatus Poribacteria bacterium]|nr:hypothetical protein [Candidatus Poribacteria bacterium]